MSIIKTYISGTLVRTTAKFTDLAGVLTDPTSVVLKYQGPGTVQTPSVTQDSTGVYHYDIDTSGWAGPGNVDYVVEWSGTGAVMVVADDKFTVTPKKL